MVHAEAPLKHAATRYQNQMKLLVLYVAAAAVLSQSFKTGDAPHGKEIFERRCSGSHSLNSEKEGPRLAGVYGRVSGTVASFTYSDALKRAHITCDSESLDKWLADPEKLVPENDMAFHVENPDERKAIITYLKDAR